MTSRRAGLSLHRETVRTLEHDSLGVAGGGIALATVNQLCILTEVPRVCLSGNLQCAPSLVPLCIV